MTAELAGTSMFAQSALDQVHVHPSATPDADLAKLSTALPDLAMHLSGQPIKISVNLVLVPVVVTNLLNRIVIGLGRDDFELIDGKRSQNIRHFSREDTPASVGIILDCSGSMKSKMERAREALAELFKTANSQDEFFLMKFADRPEEVADFTSSVDDLQSQMILGVSKGRTALLDAVYMGLTKMRQARYQKRALVIISDGGDNHSRYTEGEIKALVKEADVTIYAIGIYDRYFATHEELLGPGLLSDIASLTGGRAYTIDNPNDLPVVARRIGIELRDQYMLGYNPSNIPKDGKWHKIKVRVRARKNFPHLNVYAKKGYYSPAP
jgi:Ca-activated chloride channel family protein